MGACVISNCGVLQVWAQKWGCQMPWLPCVYFFRNLHAVFHRGCTPCILTQSVGGFHFPHVLCSIYSLEVFLTMAILTGGRGFPSVDLVYIDLITSGSFLVWLSNKESSCSAGDVRDVGSIPELRRSPGEGNCNPLQYSFLENSMDRGGWQAI